MQLGLNDKVAIVTGSGRGIGAETARALAEEGARIVVTDIDAQATAESCAALQHPPLIKRDKIRKRTERLALRFSLPDNIAIKTETILQSPAH